MAVTQVLIYRAAETEDLEEKQPLSQTETISKNVILQINDQTLISGGSEVCKLNSDLS
jgi:hypothetical protein